MDESIRKAALDYHRLSPPGKIAIAPTNGLGNHRDLDIGRFSIIYRSLNAVAIYFFWIYYSSAMLILGGAVDCLLDKDEQRGKGRAR